MLPSVREGGCQEQYVKGKPDQELRGNITRDVKRRERDILAPFQKAFPFHYRLPPSKLPLPGLPGSTTVWVIAIHIRFVNILIYIYITFCRKKNMCIYNI